MKIAAVVPLGLEEAAKVFERTDWDFANAKTGGGLHGLHPYPAKFIPQIPGQLLDIFHRFAPGPVLDPFCGSGTTLAESQARGIPSVGIDLNPIATLIASVKTNPPTRPIGPVAHSLATAAKKERVILPDIPRLLHWFSAEAAQALANLVFKIGQLEPSIALNALKVALSRIIVRVSRQDSDTRYAAVRPGASEDDVYSAFVNSAFSLDNLFRREFSNLFKRPAPAHVMTSDILTVKAEQLPFRFGMIITSPPYPNAYEYWLYHKYRMYWLGEDPLHVRAREIGARPNYFRNNPATADDFERQMAQCFGFFRACTTPFAIVCMLVGRSIIRGERIDNAQLLERAANRSDFELLSAASRQIPESRKAFNPANASITSETLLVFVRGAR